jgi:hypothetical protein
MTDAPRDTYDARVAVLRHIRSLVAATRAWGMCLPGHPAVAASFGRLHDALRSNRVYREGLPTARVKAMRGQQSSTSFNATLLRRNLTGLLPVDAPRLVNTWERPTGGEYLLSVVEGVDHWTFGIDPLRYLPGAEALGSAQATARPTRKSEPS